MTELLEFFEEVFFPVQDLDPVDAKRYRNAIGRASQILGRPVEYIDAAEPTFSKWFTAELTKLGFTPRRAEQFSLCITKLQKAMREHRRATPGKPNYLADAIDWDVIEGEDQVCAHAVDELEKIQRGIDAGKGVRHGERSHKDSY